MSQTNYMQVIDPRITQIKERIANLKIQVNELWVDIKNEDAALRVICGCQSNLWTATTPKGLGISTGVSNFYCDYHKPILMNGSGA